jgi:autotransporter-associated beta strand protein
MRTTKRKALILATATVSLLQTSASSAGTFVWNGGDGTNSLLSFGGNWVGGIAPSAGDYLQFDGNQNLSPSNNYTANTSFAGIQFNSGASAFAVGGNALTLGTGALVDLGITNNSPANQILNTPIVLAPLQSYITTTGAGNLTLAGAITRQTGATAAFNLSGGAIKTSLQKDSTGIIGGWATMVVPAGSFGAFATVDGTGNITSYTYAAANIFDGTGTLTGTGSNSNVLYVGGSTLNVGVGSTSTTLINTMLMNEQGTTARNININGTLTFNAGGGLFHADDGVATLTIAGGTITTNGTGELFVRTRISPDPNPSVGAPEGTTINSPIVDPAGGKLTFVKSGYGTLRLGATNTFSGGLFVNEGQLRPSVAGALGTGSVVCANGAFVLLGAAGTFSNSWFISGIGPTEVGGSTTQFNDGAIRFSSSGAITSGKITLLSDSSIGARSAATLSTSAGGGTIAGQITGNFNLAFNQFSNSGAASGITVSTPTLYLSNTSNNWTGNTTIGEGRVRLAVGNVIPDGPGFGNLIINGDVNSSNGYSILSLDGQSETINGLLSSGILSQDYITNSGFGTLAGTTGTLIIGNNNATAVYGGAIVDDTGFVSITKTGTGTETFTGTNTYSGPTTVNGGVLALGSGGTISSNVINVGSAGKFDVTQAGGYNVNGNQTLEGNGHVLGVATLNGGGVVAPGTVGTAGTLTFDNDLVLNGGKLHLDLSSTGSTTVGGGVNDLLVVNGTLFPQSQTSVFINRVTGPLPSNSTYTIANFGSFNASNGGTSNLILPVVRQGLTLIQNANSLQIHLGSGSPASLSWRGDNSGNTWDTNNTVAWRNGGAGPANDVFFDWDSVTFDDNGLGNSTINLNNTVSPDSLIVNTTGSYTINGGGRISGLAGIVKNGPGQFTVNTTGSNDFSGSITINAGTLAVGDGNTGNVFIPPTAITNNGALVLARSDDSTFPNPISGSGLLVKGGNGTLTLSGSSSYLGVTTITSGTLRTANASALGSATAGTVVNPGAALDVDGQNLGAEVVTVQGGQGPNGGVLENSGADQTQALQRVELTGVATFGGNSPFAGRLDIRGPTGVGGYFHGNDNDIYKTGSSTFSFVGLMQTNIGSIDIQQGNLQFERSSLGDPSKAVTIENGGTLQLFGNFTNVTKPIVFNGGTLISTSNSTETVINGPVTFNGNDAQIIPNNVKMTINSPITGNGNLQLRFGSGTLSTLVLNGSSSFSGDVNINGGTLIVNGSIPGNVNQGAPNVNAIGGSGTITHDANGNSSTTFLPGGSVNVGTLTVGGNFNTSGGGTIVFDLGKTATVGGGVNDFLNIGQSLNIGAVTTIAVNPIAGTLAGNSRYVLARASSIDPTAGTNGNLSISFLGGALADTRITSLAIDTATNANEMDLVVTGSPGSENWNGGGSTVWDLHTTANFTGGPADNQFFNLDTVNFTAGSSAVTLTGTLRPGAVNVNSAQSYTFSGVGTLTGGMTLTKAGSGQLNINTTNSYTGQTIINGGTIQIGAANALGTGGSIVIANAAGAVLNLGTFSQSTTGLTGGGASGGQIIVGGSGNFTVSVAYPNDNTYSGMLSGTGTLTKAGFGSLTLNGSVPFTGAVAVTGGTLTMGANLAGAATLNISDSTQLKMSSGSKLLGITTLNLNTTGVLDLNDSAMILDYTGASPLATIANQIKAGATDQSSIGPGNIISSAALANLGPHKTALGYADASTLGVTSFAGKAVDSTAVLVRYTFVGDTNLDGRVNALDFNAIATNFGGSGKTWSQGDFNFDATVNTSDFTAMSQNFNQALAAPALDPGLGALVPEPATLALIGAVLLPMKRRRSRRSAADARGE